MIRKNTKPAWNNVVHQKDTKTGATSELWFEEWLSDGFIDRDWTCIDGFNWKRLDYDSVYEKGKCNIFLELKSRNIDINSFKTTMIGESKLKAARKKLDKGAQVYFFFLFLGQNGSKKDLYFYDVSRSHKKLEKYCRINTGGTNKRGVNEYKNHLYIPVKFLESVKKYKNMEEYLDKKT
tara:strand:+ start:2938 stop:3474 length:537 start_codon:yes stop_codon:yes gene_type:complete